ncbi:MAG: hypothetical protein WEC59_12625 [Salibacteraceae bacterium]
MFNVVFLIVFHIFQFSDRVEFTALNKGSETITLKIKGFDQILVPANAETVLRIDPGVDVFGTTLDDNHELSDDYLKLFTVDSSHNGQEIDLVKMLKQARKEARKNKS